MFYLKIAYFSYLIIGIVVSGMVGGNPIPPEIHYDDSFSKRIGVAIWWPFVLILFVLEMIDNKKGHTK